MSTDDLTEALRIAGQARDFADPSRNERAIIELADEVDRLRAERGADLIEAEDARDCALSEVAHYEGEEARLTAERDAARAALGRVRDVVEHQARTTAASGLVVVDAVTRALEGEP
jgi:hypothetical protein